MRSTLTFYGGAEEVTGANFVLDTGTKKIMVDCGSREESETSDELAPFAYDPKVVDVLCVTHAHQDHIGRIPKLVHDGFRGAIHSTFATKDLATVMFEDALSLVTARAEKEGKEPPYAREDIDRALGLWHGHEYHEAFNCEDVTIAFLDSGHILGAGMVRLERSGRCIVFTGDLGNSPEPLLNDSESAAGAQYIVMESVYGDRVHEGREDRKRHLRESLEETKQRNGTLLIPAFSIERTQVLLSEMNDMVEREHVVPPPIYVDSPLATRVTEVYRRYIKLLNPASRAKAEAGDDLFAFKGLTVIDTTRESRGLEELPDPKVIIAGAGMSGGGRIRAHELAFLGKRSTTMLIVGYQAPGTVGRRLQDGARSVEIDGKWVRVHAQIDTLSGYSGHADRDGLMDFLERSGEKLERAFIVMGEPRSSLYLAQRAKDFFGLDAYVPTRGERVSIDF